MFKSILRQGLFTATIMAATLLGFSVITQLCLQSVETIGFATAFATQIILVAFLLLVLWALLDYVKNHVYFDIMLKTFTISFTVGASLTAFNILSTDNAHLAGFFIGNLYGFYSFWSYYKDSKAIETLPKGLCRKVYFKELSK